MALTKVTYTDLVTIIGAQNLNDIQDAIIALEEWQSEAGADIPQILADIAPRFSNSTNYSAGDCVIVLNKLYQFTAAHPAGNWTGTDATEVNVTSLLKEAVASLSGEVDDLKSALDDVYDDDSIPNLLANATVYKKSENSITATFDSDTKELTISTTATEGSGARSVTAMLSPKTAANHTYILAVEYDWPSSSSPYVYVSNNFNQWFDNKKNWIVQAQQKSGGTVEYYQFTATSAGWISIGFQVNYSSVSSKSFKVALYDITGIDISGVNTNTWTRFDDLIRLNKSGLLSDAVSYVTPEMFGAVGDGTTDDTEAIKRALLEKKTLLLRGLYAISEPIRPYSGTKIIGTSSNAGFIQTDLSKDVICFARDYQEVLIRVEIRNVTLKWNGLPGVGTAGIRFYQVGDTYDGYGVFESVFENIWINNAYYGIYADSHEPLWNNKFHVVQYNTQYQALYYTNGFGNLIHLAVLGALPSGSTVTRTTCVQCDDGATFEELDIEDWEAKVLTCQGTYLNVIFNEIHLERCSYHSNLETAPITIGNSPVQIKYLYVYDCTFSSDNYTALCIVQVYGSSKTGTANVTIEYMDVRKLTVSANVYLIGFNGNGHKFFSLVTEYHSADAHIAGKFPSWTTSDNKDNTFFQYTPAFS